MERKGEEKVEETTRIYVGGLGEKVTNDDLRKIFSSLGRVTAVDIVRTKGRSFGYVDFSPSSDKSLPKLFSTVLFLSPSLTYLISSLFRASFQFLFAYSWLRSNIGCTV